MSSKSNRNPIPLNNNQQLNPKPNKHKPSQDQRLVELTQHFNLFKDENNVTYIEIIIYDQGFRKTGKNIVRIRSNDFKEYINDFYYNNYFRYPQKNVLESFISHLIYRAKQRGTPIKIFNRLGIDKNDNIYIDLANGNDEIVKVTKDGWKVDKYPLLFTRYDHTAPLPSPLGGGDLKDLLPFTPVANTHEECLLLSWLVASLIPDIERCFLLLEGPPGSRKSTIANRLKSLIDPMKGDALILTSKEAEVAQQLGQHCIPFFDNITSVSKDISNMFCTCFGGSVFSKKALYTDDGSIVFNLSGNIVFTSIQLERPRPDFLQRTYKISTVKQKGFKSSRKLKQQFNQIAPQLFGALLDTLVKVLNVIDQIPEPDEYRTVDFDHYCAAAAEVLGYGQKTFWEARNNTESIKTKGMIQAYPVIQALKAFLQICGGYWKGCMNELLTDLKALATNPDKLPKSPNYLSNMINSTLKVEIETAGITVTDRGNGHCHLYEITLNDQPNNNVAPPPKKGTSTVVEALDQAISQQIKQVSGTTDQETDTSSKVEPQQPGTNSSSVISDSNDHDESRKSDLDLDPETSGNAASRRKMKSGTGKPSSMDQAVGDLFDNLDDTQSTRGNQNPFLIDDTPDDEDQQDQER